MFDSPTWSAVLFAVSAVILGLDLFRSRSRKLKLSVNYRATLFSVFGPDISPTAVIAAQSTVSERRREAGTEFV